MELLTQLGPLNLVKYELMITQNLDNENIIIYYFILN